MQKRKSWQSLGRFAGTGQGERRGSRFPRKGAQSVRNHVAALLPPPLASQLHLYKLVQRSQFAPPPPPPPWSSLPRVPMALEGQLTASSRRGEFGPLDTPWTSSAFTAFPSAGSIF